MERVQTGLPQSPFAQAELDRHVIESPRSEAAMEMPQSRNNYPDNGNPDVRPGLIDNKEIQAATFGKLDASKDLVAPIEVGKPAGSRPPGGGLAVRHYVGVLAQGQWHRQRVAAVRGGPGVSRAPHPIDRQQLIEPGHRPERGNTEIEIRARGKLNALLPVFLPVQ